MGKKELKKLQNFNFQNTQFSKDQLKLIQKIAFSAVYSPFEINEALKLIQKTRAKLETSIVQPISEKITPYKKKIFKFKDKLFVKIKNSLSKFDNKEKPPYYIDIKDKYSVIMEKIKEYIAVQTDKAISLIFEKKAEALVIKKAQTMLDIKITKIYQIQRLNLSQRQQLLDSLYPFDINLTGKIRKYLNYSFNISLGLVVASNIPFTGATVNLLTTIKTVIYLSNRIQLLSAIYGYPVICKESLFEVATKIVASIIDYENNPKHQPLEPAVIGILYNYQKDSKLYDLLKKSTIKDLYISIPLVGSLSLAKISIDEESITQLTLHLFQNYYSLELLKKNFSEKIINQEIKKWRDIYQVLKKSDFIKNKQKVFIKDIPNKKKLFDKKILKFIKKIKNFSTEKIDIRSLLEQEAQNIYSQFYKQKKITNLAEFVDNYLQ